MPILLTTSFTFQRPGEAPQVFAFAAVQAINTWKFLPGEEELHFTAVYGNVVDGNFVPGPHEASKRFVFENIPAHIGPGNVQVDANDAYNDIVLAAQTQGPTGTPILQEMAGYIYSWLLAQPGYGGTIV